VLIQIIWKLYINKQVLSKKPLQVKELISGETEFLLSFYHIVITFLPLSEHFHFLFEFCLGEDFFERETLGKHF
jgi:hypothetical protein